MRQRFELLLQALALQRQFSDSVIDQFTVRFASADAFGEWLDDESPLMQPAAEGA